MRIADGRIVEIAQGLAAHANEAIVDADDDALLPGLHDHHLQHYSLVASLASVPCGPPQVHTRAELAGQLQVRAAQLPPGGWLRGIGYHESVAGALDRHTVDRLLPDNPIRIQHRSGRLWLLNSAAPHL